MRGRYYLPGDVQLSVEAQDLLARIFRPDPKKRIGLAAMRRHPWLQQDAPSVLGQAAAAAAAAAAPAQSEDGIRDVIHRARQRRLRRLTAAVDGGCQSRALAGTSHQSVAVTASS